MQGPWSAAGMMLLTLVLIGLWAVLYQIVRQQGRVLLRLDDIERQLRETAERAAQFRAPPAAPPGAPAQPRGLGIGTPIPSFALGDLDGRIVTREELRGSRMLLVHWGPQCGFCEQIAPDLAALHPALERHGVRLVLIAHGDAAMNRALAERHGLACPILLQGEGETIEAFRTFGTPVAYLADEEGRVADAIAIGANEVPALARRALEMATRNGDAKHGAAKHGAAKHGAAKNARAAAKSGRADARTPLPGERPIVESRIVRDGLKAGTTAPTFALPDLAGRTTSLETYRGRQVLLVFSDPQCGPCDELAPELARLDREHGGNGVALIMIGRGEIEENRRKAKEHSIRFPVVLQRQWEMSKEYGIFATPVAFLIGADGVIARDVAAGADEILALANEAVAPRTAATAER